MSKAVLAYESWKDTRSSSGASVSTVNGSSVVAMTGWYLSDKKRFKVMSILVQARPVGSFTLIFRGKLFDKTAK